MNLRDNVLVLDAAKASEERLRLQRRAMLGNTKHVPALCSYRTNGWPNFHLA